MSTGGAETLAHSRAVAGRAFQPRDHYYLWAALGIALLATVGFARTFYLRPLFRPDRLALPVLFHGPLMSSWYVLFIVQASLIPAGRVRWHRRLGVLGAALALVIVAWGIWLTGRAVAMEGARHVVGKFHYLLGINVVNLLLFLLLIATALGWRKRPEYHKRLMLLAAAVLLAPAVARIVLLATHNPVIQFVAFYALILACVVVDALRHRRVHPALAYGAIFVIGAFQASFWLVQTHAYMLAVKYAFG